MPDDLTDLDPDLSRRDRDDWIAGLDEIGEAHGYLERPGGDHLALFVDAGPKLLVTFESRERAQGRPRGQPRGLQLARENGWSLLAIVAEPDTWYRGDRLYRYFDRLIDDGFFEDFDATLFFGAHDGGYAAAAYSVASPGCRVLALRPVATLDPRVARWDRRYHDRRGLDFTSRYGYAPDMIEAADRATIVADLGHAPDAMHAALFRAPNVRILDAPLVGQRLEQSLDQFGILVSMIEAAMDGQLTQGRFAQLWRERRDNMPYLKGLLRKLDTAGRIPLAAAVARHGARTGTPDPFVTWLSDNGFKLPETATIDG